MIDLAEMSSDAIRAAITAAQQDYERTMYEVQCAYRDKTDDIMLRHQQRTDELQTALAQAEAREHERRRKQNTH